MKKRITLVAAVLVALCAQSSAFAAKPTEQDKADAAQINSACEVDAKATGCSGMVVGKGLLKCMRKYKQENKSYKFSDGCRTAMKQLKSDREAGK